MKVAVDCRALRKAPAGIPNFIVMAINEMVRQYPDWEIYLLSNEEFHPELAQEIKSHLKVKVVIDPFFVFRGVSFLWLLVKAGSIVKKINPDLFWGPAFLLPPFLPAKVKTLVTVHDVVFKEQTHTMSFWGKLYSGILLNFSINKADQLWANSRYTARSIQKYYPKRKNKDIFTGFFINKEIFKPLTIPEDEKQQLLAKYQLSEKFLLFVGTLEPRKNLSFLLSVMPHLKHLEFKLLVVGAKGWGETNIKAIIESEDYPKTKVIFPGFIPTSDLAKLYNLAAIFISTSLNEGFGMPQLEAMACGCPVISPHNSAMIEVVEGAGETVATWVIEDWVKAIEKVLGNRNLYIDRGFERVQQYEAKSVINKLSAQIGLF